MWGGLSSAEGLTQLKREVSFFFCILEVGPKTGSSGGVSKHKLQHMFIFGFIIPVCKG